MSLIKEASSDNDYFLPDDEISCWITVKNLSVYIVRTDEGVSVDIFAKGAEAGESIAGTWALDTEADDDEKAMGMLKNCEHDWHTNKIHTYCWKCGIEK